MTHENVLPPMFKSWTALLVANKDWVKRSGFEVYEPNLRGDRVAITRRGELPKERHLPEPDTYRIDTRFAKSMAMDELLAILPDKEGCEALYRASHFATSWGNESSTTIPDFPFALLKLML